MSTTTCPSCNQPASGNFCQNCGGALAPGFCTQCGSKIEALSGNCSKCGSARSGGGAGGGGQSPVRQWLVPGGILVVAVVLALFFVVRINGGGSPPAAAEPVSAGAVPPDISQLSPRERFDRLYNRVMQAAEQGDAATMQQFSPMALSAYEMLDEVDADARYHAALLKLHSGDVEGSVAEADAILAEAPNHLFGLVVKGTLAKWQQDPAALAAVYGQYLEVYEEELAIDRVGYNHHLSMLQGFRTDALAAQTPATEGG
jgi:hypothetical protein